MKFATRSVDRPLRTVAIIFAIALGAMQFALAGDFSVTPIRAELKPGALSETITVQNHASSRLRASVKLMEWTQDVAGNDVYRESSDLIYFPRQLEVGPESKRLVRVGVKTPGGIVERTYRLFIEEEPESADSAGRAQVALYFRFGVPIFIPPAIPKPQPEIMEPTLAKGKLSLVVKNQGNQHFRLVKLAISDGAGYLQEIQGWYSLAGSSRTYTADIPLAVCQKAKVLSVKLEGEGEGNAGLRVERKLNVDPASCT